MTHALISVIPKSIQIRPFNFKRKSMYDLIFFNIIPVIIFAPSVLSVKSVCEYVFNALSATRVRTADLFGLERMKESGRDL